MYIDLLLCQHGVFEAPAWRTNKGDCVLSNGVIHQVAEVHTVEKDSDVYKFINAVCERGVGTIRKAEAIYNRVNIEVEE